ncbi:restriction endonuclease subunit S [Pseudoalteromonas sp. SWYJZ98]|uniref:restriction endonuclease subunit S n=1 Tax=Pseudoalteromonas sp. SWYJZ98 TaxID=2792060 RepID=UPI0018CFB366|nr:restriction endonuclease subunit S [Pseudoalteromonas sp. SWYJZ98]MBH0032712.1 restriction endonuclease subunit S [Pseudoalteromonas sp. SWYJZ98]
MGSDWPLVSLGDYCVKIGSGATPRGGSSVYKEYGEICLIRSQNIYNDGFKSQGLVYIDEDAAKKLKNVVIEKNDILLNITGDSVARVCLAVERYLPARVNQHVAIIRPNPKEFDARYLRYVISSPFMQKVLLNLASAGATRNALTKTMIETLEVSKPPLIIQKNIADCLESLDDKIFLNNETNQTLEQMAQALFKSWFVDFDPVFDNLLASVDFKLESLENRLPDNLKLKAQRRLAVLNSLENAAECKASLIALAHELQAQLPTKEATQAAVQILGKTAETPVKANVSANPKILAQHANTHFPNEFEHNEQLGWIPKGWESKTIDELCKINPESWTKKNAPEVVKYVDLANAKNGSVGEAIEYSFSEAPSRARRILRPHDTIIGVVRPANRSFAYVNEDNLTGSTGFAVVRANNQNCRAFAYFSLTNDDCIQEFTRIADGAAYPAIKPEDVAKTYCVYSNNKILDAFESIAGNIMSGVARNQTQTKTLTKLRDTLLPKLIAGEITINKDI